MIKGILFDYDGTLSDRVTSAYRMYRWMVSEILPDMYHDSVDFELIVQRCMLWDEFGTIRKEHVLEMLKKNYAPDLDVPAWKEKWYTEFHRFQVAMPNSHEVIQKLKEKYRLGIVTNGEARSQSIKVDKLDMRKYFQTVIVSGAFGKDKPDVSIYQQAAKDLGLECNEIAFIGDTFSTDIAGALKAGMLPIWYCNEHRGVSNLDVKQVSSYQELEDIFLNHTEWNQ
ncbi:MAG: HAD family hydrolase [Erysipelotrichaceae bacterium]|nr:HAD family hydrolase [Erysipelotrichaceae bacterium]MDY6035275.1 HAD family hydrolase [Bulleidia sp.]